MSTDELASYFKALSEPVRVRVMALLLAKGELCVCELVDALALSQGVVSRHLAYLRNNKLVTARRQGTWMYYKIDPEQKTSLAPLLTMIRQAAKNSDELAADLARLKDQPACA